ncbi:hypothetical protein EOD39_12783 [Acipenser ruthenus]|uniref:Uncharacterized protein n=1 Tax=Acipenser ruthenus TaxID=7906 RepID=A0A662YRI9_ACIRT|nr:hypothetical protein EOD39_12783 [Acipenser ruthenus]
MWIVFSQETGQVKTLVQSPGGDQELQRHRRDTEPVRLSTQCRQHPDFPDAQAQDVRAPPTQAQDVRAPPTQAQGVRAPPSQAQGVRAPPSQAQGVRAPPSQAQDVRTPPSQAQDVAGSGPLPRTTLQRPPPDPGSMPLHTGGPRKGSPRHRRHTWEPLPSSTAPVRLPSPGAQTELAPGTTTSCSAAAVVVAAASFPFSSSSKNNHNKKTKTVVPCMA